MSVKSREFRRSIDFLLIRILGKTKVGLLILRKIFAR
jgi:hypothetical protein